MTSANEEEHMVSTEIWGLRVGYRTEVWKSVRKFWILCVNEWEANGVKQIDAELVSANHSVRASQLDSAHAGACQDWIVRCQMPLGGLSLTHNSVSPEQTNFYGNWTSRIAPFMPGSNDSVQWTHAVEEYVPRSHLQKVVAFFYARAASSRVQPMSDDSVRFMIFDHIS